MSKKNEKKAEEGKSESSKKEKGPRDEIAETRKKRKLFLILGLTAVAAVAAAGGGFFVYKTFVQKPHSMSAKKDDSDNKAKNNVDAEHKSNGQAGEGKESNDGKKADKHEKNGDATQPDAKPGAKTDANSAVKEAAPDSKDSPANDKQDGSNKNAGHGNAKQTGKETGKEKNAEGKDSTAAKEEKSDIKLFKSDESFGETYALPKMDLNLGNPLENRYLRIGVSIEYTGGKEQQDELKKREPQIRDLIISSVSTRTRLDLLTDKGKEKLRRELINKMNETFSRPVKTIYFTDFLVE